MYILYLDDSGSANNASEEYFVLGGVAVPEYRIRKLSYELEKLADSINPNNAGSVEFHASEIFSGKHGIWTNFCNRNDRIKIIKDVLLVLGNAKLEDVATFACAVHKASFLAADVVQTAYEDISNRFDLMLQRMSDSGKVNGIIVFDKSSYEQSLQSITANFRKSGNQWGNQMRNICEVPMFVDSKASRLIQLADHVAYAVFRRYNANDINYFNCIEGTFDQHEGIIHGLSHKKPATQICTCPACLTRK
jgi:hypothetical protein